VHPDHGEGCSDSPPKQGEARTVFTLEEGKATPISSEPERAEQSEQLPPMEDTETNQFIDEQEHEQGQPEASVCTGLHLHIQ
jgi:hypothetical protein